jgi:hypothetical protein
MTVERTVDDLPPPASGSMTPEIPPTRYEAVKTVSKTGATTLPEQVPGRPCDVRVGSTSGPREKMNEHPELASPSPMAVARRSEVDALGFMRLPRITNSAAGLAPARRGNSGSRSGSGP